MSSLRILSGDTGLFTFCLAAVLTVGLGAGIWALGVQKPLKVKDKTVEGLYSDDSPVVVTDLRGAGRTLELGDKFEDDEKWLSHLSLQLKNVSHKTIVFVEVVFDFPETKSTGNEMAFPVRFGRNPHAPVVSGEPKRLLPGETASLALSKDDYSKLKSFLEQRHPIASIHKATIRIPAVAFEDGTIWSNGSWLRPDPNNLNKLIPADTP